jgi:methionyl-tRNA formyltransferase
MGIDVRLVVTHDDIPGETIWFDSVASLARSTGLPAIMPADPNDPAIVQRIAGLAPDFVFSFYYRLMLCSSLLRSARRGALNMHGSLLPRYRGRAPVNWAILKGETETGATLHYMTDKPDAGDIVGQFAVPILPDDTALVVFRKVTFAAELLLSDVLPALLDGAAPRRPQDPSQASYFGRRSPEDGRIDWSRPAAEIHNLVRAVAPPYPGAFFDLDGATVKITRTARVDSAQPGTAPMLYLHDGACLARCGDGASLRIVGAELKGTAVDPCKLLPARSGQRALSR